MRLGVVCSLLVVLLAEVLADTALNSTESNDQEEDEYEDIAVAESQDIVHRRAYLNSEEPADQPRVRPRGRKRRRRLRKRPRSTTPSYIEEYDPQRTVKEEEEVPFPVVEEEVNYQRRRPTKRRRRPSRIKPEYDAENPEPEPEVPLESQLPYEPHQENPPEDYHSRPRNTKRRRRKGGRKRIRVTTELSSELNNNTQEEALAEVTTQPLEVVMQSNNPPERERSGELAASHQDETTDSVFSKAFTPKEITEINHELESLSRLPSKNEYQVSGLGAFGNFQSANPDTNVQKTENDEVEFLVPTTKDYAWINKFNPHEATKTPILDEVTTQETTFGIRDKKESETKKEPEKGIKNIEKIIENRKSLFATSKRLPPTSAVIRRRLTPQKPKNFTTIQETVIDNTIPTINQANLKTSQKPCKSVECVLNRTSISANNIIPSSLIPSGFPTMPEVLSTAELIQKTSKEFNSEEENFSTFLEQSDEENESNKNNDIIVITPSTLIRSQNIGGNLLNTKINSERKPLLENVDQIYTQKNVQTSISASKEDIKPIETTSMSSTETKVTASKSTKTTVTTERPTTILDIQSDQSDGTNENKSMTSETEKLTLDGVDVSNINDEILELIMDEMGKARVKRILELRNMTLSELIAHRERGAGHFSAFNNDQNFTQEKKENEGVKPVSLSVHTRGTTSSSEEAIDEEKTEKMIVEKAKQFLHEFKKTEETVTGVMKISHKEKFGEKLKPAVTVEPPSKVEGTHSSVIQFPDDGILGAFPKYMYDIAGKRSKANTPTPNDKPSLYKETINKPKEIQQVNDKREPRVFESMPKFSSEATSQDDLELFPYPDWRIAVSRPSTEKSIGFPGISKEIMIVATSKSTSKSANLEDVVLLDEGEEVHHLRNHILGGKIDVESGDSTDEDYPEPKKVPASVKSAIAASGALLGLAIFGFLAVLVSCKIRQRRARLRARQDILCEHLAEEFRSSQRGRTPVLRKSPFNNGIHSNTASNRNYYLWRTLRKTFQYE